MIINTLTKSEKGEGLTLEFVNSMKMHIRASPVMLQEGDEPVRLMVCATGYWIVYETGKFLRDRTDKLIVVSVRDATVARARFLMHYGEKEKEDDVKELLRQRKAKAKEVLKKLTDFIKRYSDIRDGRLSTVEKLLRNVVNQQNDPATHKAFAGMEMEDRQNISRIPYYEQLYAELKECYDKDNIMPILWAFNIEKREEPLITARYDDDEAMRIVKKVFGKEALDNPNFSMDRVYAVISVERGQK